MALLAVPATVAVSCKDDGMDVKFTDKGPEMTIESCANEAFMGDSVRFSIKLNDEFPLSTLKAKLLFDGTSVSDLTIRTKTYGTYDAAIFVPLLKGIPDGTAEITFTAQNTGLGITEETVEVNVSRPAPSTLTLLSGGKEYTMTKSGDFSYEVTDAFPAEASALIKCVPAAGQPAIWLGWDGSALKPVPAESSSTLPFPAVPIRLLQTSCLCRLLHSVASPHHCLSLPTWNCSIFSRARKSSSPALTNRTSGIWTMISLLSMRIIL